MLYCRLLEKVSRIKNNEVKKYSVDNVDVRPEMEKEDEWAAMASAALSAQRSISSAISTLSTLY